MKTELTKQQSTDKGQLEVVFYQLMNKHNLTGWTWRWETDMRAYGVCNYNKKTISINFYVALSNPEEAIDTFLHEIAHALTRGHGHDKVWKVKCVEIGARPETKCSIVKVAKNFETVTQLKYTIRCNSCGLEAQRARKFVMSCSKCSKEYNPKYNFEWIVNKK